MFPWEPACQSSSLDSPVIKIKCERVNGCIASCGRAKMLSGSVLYPKYASVCKEGVFFQLFQMDCCSFELLLLAVLSLHTQNFELTVKNPCGSAVVVLRPCAGYTQHFLPRLLGTAFLAARGYTEPVFFITPLRPFLPSFPLHPRNVFFALFCAGL